MSEFSEDFSTFITSAELGELDEKYPDRSRDDASLEKDCLLVCQLLPGQIGDLYEANPSGMLRTCEALLHNLRIAYDIAGPYRVAEYLEENIDDAIQLVDACREQFIRFNRNAGRLPMNVNHYFSKHNLLSMTDFMSYRASLYEQSILTQSVKRRLEDDMPRERACLEKIAPALTTCVGKLFLDEDIRKTILQLSDEKSQACYGAYFEYAALSLAGGNFQNLDNQEIGSIS